MKAQTALVLNLQLFLLYYRLYNIYQFELEAISFSTSVEESGLPIKYMLNVPYCQGLLWQNADISFGEKVKLRFCYCNIDNHIYDCLLLA